MHWPGEKNMQTDQVPTDELHEIRTEIAALRSDLNRYTEQVHHQQAISLLSDFRNNCADAIVSGYRENGCDAIGKEAGDCSMWKNCRPVFGALFGETLANIQSGELSPDDIEAIRGKMTAMKSQAVNERCASCFSEAENQLNQQLGMLEAIGVCRKEPDTDVAVGSLPEKEAAALFSDALGSPVRIQVLKALYHDGKTFTDLSKLTGIRGGNLLFHLEKLQKCGMILQRAERGEYRISYRGYELLNTVAELVQKLD
jgi:DNA-binding transcriptional ArsR family regulator/DNA-binding FrmR family transcriptional regulator